MRIHIYASTQKYYKGHKQTTKTNNTPNEHKILRNYGDILHEKKGCVDKNEDLEIEGEWQM